MSYRKAAIQHNCKELGLEGRNIDTVELVCDVTEGPTYREIRCCIKCEMESAGEQLLARTEQKWAGTGFIEPIPGMRPIPTEVKVIDVDWVGGAVADSLNGDTELKRVLLQEGETDIQIWHEREWLKMLIPSARSPAKPSLFEPSKALFEAYDRIAAHVRRAMTL